MKSTGLLASEILSHSLTTRHSRFPCTGPKQSGAPKWHWCRTLVSCPRTQVHGLWPYIVNRLLKLGLSFLARAWGMADQGVSPMLLVSVHQHRIASALNCWTMWTVESSRPSSSDNGVKRNWLTGSFVAKKKWTKSLIALVTLLDGIMFIQKMDFWIWSGYSSFPQ